MKHHFPGTEPQMKFAPEPLCVLIRDIFAAAGSNPDEADSMGQHLVGANLVGHDSHGVIRVSFYIDWMRQGKVFANRELDVVFENDAMALVDAQMGYGIALGKQAIRLGLDKCRNNGVSVIALRNSSHLGRIGYWAEMVAAENKVSLNFVNTTGLGMLVAPVGGIGRRLSANPLAIGIPVPNQPPLVLDISTSMVAEGKLKVAYNKGVSVPDGCIIDAEGNPTNDPKVFYGDPPGAILPFGGHKGYGLGVITDILAGALTGGGCTQEGKQQLEQGMLSIMIDPETLQTSDAFFGEVRALIDWVKGADKRSPDSEILVPGEIEAQHRADRQANGIPLDDATWSQICETARSLQVSEQTIEAAVLSD